MNNQSVGLSSFQIFVMCAVSSALGTLCLAPLLGSGADGSWIYAVLIASAFAAIIAGIYLRTMRRYSFGCFGDFLSCCLPRGISAVLLFLFGLFFLSQSALSAYFASESVRMYLLERTPSGVILLALLITSSIISDYGTRYLARCCELLILLLIIPLALLLILCISNVDFSEAAVAFQPDLRGIIKMLPAALLSCGGGAAFVVLLPNKAENGQFRYAAAGFAASALISALLYACSAGVFTTDGTARLELPFIEMARSVSIGSISFTERFDTVFITIMLTASILQLALFCGCASQCISSAVGLCSHRCITYLALPAVFILAYYAENSELLSVILQVSLRGVMYVIPAVIVIVSIAARIFVRGVQNA